MMFKYVFINYCRTVPIVSACVDRNLQGCSQAEKNIVMEIVSELKSQVRDHCPQVDCNVCQAEQCVNRLVAAQASQQDVCRYV